MKIKLILFLLFISAQAFSQSGYKIEFKIRGWKDTTVYLGHYYGEQTYLKDTAKVSHAGEFFFDNKNTLPQGVYFLVMNKRKIVDIVIGHDQFFKIETDTANLIKNLKVTGDEDNRLFFENVAFNIERNKEAEPFIKTLKDTVLKEDQKKAAREGFTQINERVMAYQKEIIGAHPMTMTARLLKSTQLVVVPDPPKKANGNIDSTFQLKYYRQHFFDNFDLSDDALIRLPQPLYQEKVKEYLTKLFIPQPDTITKAIKELVAKVKKNQETYKYLVWTCVGQYWQPEIMGLDEVYVNLYDHYFASGEMDFWMNTKMKQNLKEQADKIRPCMIGRTGANLIMQDQNLQPRSVYDIKAKYTILFIFKPDCGHCREETPKLVDFYNKSKAKHNLEVYAVSTDTSMKMMREFIKEFKTPWITVNGPRSYIKEHFSKFYHSDTTPAIYILDDKKKIIAKKLPVKQLDDFLTRHEKFEQAKKASPPPNGHKSTSGN